MQQKTADHGFDYFTYEPSNPHAAAAVFKKGLAGTGVEKEEAEQFKTAVLQYLCKEYKRHDWVLQLHFGCARDNNTTMYEKLGKNIGCDSIALLPVPELFHRFSMAYIKATACPKQFSIR